MPPLIHKYQRINEPPQNQKERKTKPVTLNVYNSTPPLSQASTAYHPPRLKKVLLLQVNKFYKKIAASEQPKEQETEKHQRQHIHPEKKEHQDFKLSSYNPNPIQFNPINPATVTKMKNKAHHTNNQTMPRFQIQQGYRKKKKNKIKRIITTSVVK